MLERVAVRVGSFWRLPRVQTKMPPWTAACVFTCQLAAQRVAAHAPPFLERAFVLDCFSVNSLQEEETQRVSTPPR